MKGQVLDYSIQTHSGIISGANGNRYSFTGADWQSAGFPRAGMAVDFNVAGNSATGIYLDNPTAAYAAPAPAVSRSENAGGNRAGAGAGRSGASSLMPMFGLIVGIPTLFLFWIPLLGWLMMMVGLGLSVAGLVTARQNGQSSLLAIAAIVLNAIPVSIHIASAIVIILLVKVVKAAAAEFMPILQSLPFF